MSEPASHPSESLLSAWLDGDGEPRERRELADHLGRCGRCRDLVARLRSLSERLDSHPDQAPPRDLWPALAGRLRAEPRDLPSPRAPRRRWRPVWLAPAAAALAGLVVVIGLWTADFFRPERPVPPGRQLTGLEETAEEAVILHRDAADAMRARLASEALPPELETLLDTELAAYDAAVNETRAALERSPDDPELERHLLGTLRAEVRLLQRTDASVEAVF